MFLYTIKNGYLRTLKLIYNKTDMRLKYLSLFMLMFLLFSCASKKSVQTDVNLHPKREFRGAWIQAVNGQFTGMSEQEMKKYLTDMLNNLQKVNVNAVIFQVRVEGDALYESRYEPWSRFLTGVQGKSPGWDPSQGPAGRLQPQRCQISCRRSRLPAHKPWPARAERSCGDDSFLRVRAFSFSYLPFYFSKNKFVWVLFFPLNIIIILKKSAKVNEQTSRNL
jgi:hypothetical protein